MLAIICLSVIQFPPDLQHRTGSSRSIGQFWCCQNSAWGKINIVPHFPRRSAHVLRALPVYVHVEEKTSDLVGYQTFYCRDCGRHFDERTGTPFNHLQFLTDIVLLAVLWRLRYKLGFRDVAELLLQRRFEVSHETIWAWEFRFAPMVSERLRSKRRGRVGVSCYLDETYIKVSGHG